jgi:hypothetical protein
VTYASPGASFEKKALQDGEFVHWIHEYLRAAARRLTAANRNCSPRASCFLEALT